MEPDDDSKSHFLAGVFLVLLVIYILQRYAL